MKNTLAFPGSATVLIRQFGRLHCTGWMVSKDTLMTAGHCVRDGGSDGEWTAGLTFVPGSNGGDAPFGVCRSRRTYTFAGWNTNGNREYDGAIVKLDCTVGDTVGWFGLWVPTGDLTGRTSLIRGYPGDKPSTQWRSTDWIRASEPDRLYYQNDTTGGVSGSPVHVKRPAGSANCSGFCAMGIHTHGLGSSGLTANNNSGTRLTQAKYDQIVSVINTP